MTKLPAKPPAATVKAGEIVRVHVHSANHDKFLICICPDSLKFITINSNPWPFDLAAQVVVTKDDFNFLTHKSYISVCQPIRLTTMDLNVLDAVKHRRLGHCPEEICQKIKGAADQSITLTGSDKALIEKNL